MSVASNPFMGKVFVGDPTSIGTLGDRYNAFLVEGETVEMEFKGLRDGMVFTTLRIIVVNAQGIMGKKVEVTSFPWRSISAFSLENSGTVDLDAELKVCGSGWGVCEVQFGRSTPVATVAQYLNGKLLTR